MALTEAEELELLELEEAEALAKKVKKTLPPVIEKPYFTPPSSGLNLPTRALANAAQLVEIPARIGMDVIKEGYGVAKKIVPEFVKKDIKSTVGQISLAPDIKEEIGSVVGKYEGFKGRNPNIASAAESVAPIGASILPAAASVKRLRTALPILKTAPKVQEATVGGKIKKAVEGIIEEQTAMPIDVLKMANTKEGMAFLKANKGKTAEIGQKLVENVYNPIDALPEREIIKKILPEIGGVDVSGVKKSLIGHIVENPAPDMVPVNEKIAKTINWIADVERTNGGSIPADQLINLRKQVDDMIGDSFGKESGRYVSALKDARHEMKTAIIDAADMSGNSDYKKAMESFANKLEILSKIKDRLGSSANVGEGRAEGFIRNLFGKNKEYAREMIKDYDAVFGKNTLNQAWAARLADYLTPSGELPYLTKWPTGRGGILGTAGALSVGSPKVASKYILPVLNKAPKTAAAITAGGVAGAGYGGKKLFAD